MSSLNFMKDSRIFNRDNSTLGVMDDLQVAIHTYDGCAKGCSGCIVDKHFKNRMRFQSIMPEKDLAFVHKRVLEYYEWIKENLNTKDYGYFGKDRYQVDHFSYTMRFGNHSELPMDELAMISRTLDAPFKVFSTAPTEDITKFKNIKKMHNGRYFLEIIYDPIADDALEIKNMILDMRKDDILGYPEVLITRRLLDNFSPEEFVNKKVAPLGDIGTQMQFGRYVPSKTRGYNMTQVVPLDEEVEWLQKVAKRILELQLDIHPIPLGEYAVTFLDEYEEDKAMVNGVIDEKLLPKEKEFNMFSVKEHVRDIFMSSIYIDHKLDLYIWSESMGQHVLDSNFGFKTFGSIKDKPIHELLNSKLMEQLLTMVIRDLLVNKKCSSCRYKTMCASHAIPLFRKFQKDDGKHCYGYIPVVREFQKDVPFLNNMIKGFRELEF